MCEFSMLYIWTKKSEILGGNPKRSFYKLWGKMFLLWCFTRWQTTTGSNYSLDPCMPSPLQSEPRSHLSHCKFSLEFSSVLLTPAPSSHQYYHSPPGWWMERFTGRQGARTPPHWTLYRRARRPVLRAGQFLPYLNAPGRRIPRHLFHLQANMQRDSCLALHGNGAVTVRDISACMSSRHCSGGPSIVLTFHADSSQSSNKTQTPLLTQWVPRYSERVSWWTASHYSLRS